MSCELASQNIIVKIVEPGRGDAAFHGDRAWKMRARAGSQATIRSSRADSVIAHLGTRMATPERMANAIYGATTDGTKRLRYLAGDDVEHLVDARRKLSDADYEIYMRSRFA